VPVQWAQEEILAGERSYPAGTFFLSLPFKIESKIPCDVIVLWLEQQARREGLLCIQKTAEQLSTRSIALVPPRIALFLRPYNIRQCSDALSCFPRHGL